MKGKQGNNMIYNFEMGLFTGLIVGIIGGLVLGAVIVQIMLRKLTLN